MVKVISNMQVDSLNLSPLSSLENNLNLLNSGLDRSPILEVKGYPVRIYASRQAEFCKFTFTNQDTCTYKLPCSMPKLQSVMLNSGSFILSGEQDWQERKKILMQAFGPQSLGVNLEPLKSCSLKELNNWDHHASQQKEFFVYSDLKKIICDFIFSSFFGFELDNKTLEKISTATYFLESHFVYDLEPLSKDFSSRYQSYERFLLDTFAQTAKSKHIKKDSPLDIFLKSEMSPNEIIGEMSSVHFGSSITATSMLWLLYLVGSASKEVQNKLFEEAQKFNWNSLDPKSLQKEFPYAAACVKESLRLYPSAWGLPRYSKADQCISNYDIKKDSLLIPMIYFTHRDPIYWPQALNFQPDRFIGTESKIQPFTYTPFAAGPRSCAGSHIASKILQILLLFLVQRYEIQLQDSIPPVKFGFILSPETEKPIMLKNRKG